MVQNGGNVGINTTTPQYKLDVNGTVHTSGAAILDSGLMVTGNILATGNVGIGTTTPQYKLDVNGTFHAKEKAKLDSALEVSNKISVPSGVNINLKGPYDDAHYIRNFNDDTDGFGVSVGFSIKRYTDLSTLFSVSANGLATLSSADILGDAQLSARVMSPDYVSKTTGWGITRAGAADFRNLDRKSVV